MRLAEELSGRIENQTSRTKMTTEVISGLKPVVISSQRSGLNFLRVCIESLTGQRTPGKALLVEEGIPTFIRTHDAANLSKKEGGAWREIDDEVAKGRKIALLIRDPLEIYARELKIATPKAARFKLDLYVANLNHFCALECRGKNYFHYEDFTVSPKSLAELIEFLEIRGENDTPVTEQVAAREWDKMQQTGRDLYDINQKRAGGSMTRNSEDAGKFHQLILSEEQKELVVQIISEEVSVAGKQILARYIPGLS